MTTLRLLSYNVRSLRDDRDAVVRVIRAAEPDVVAIQEAPRFLRWRSTCAALARKAGLVIVSGGRPAGANLLLSTLAVDVERSWDVPFSRDRGLHQRATALAMLTVGGSRFVIAGVHLDLQPDPRLRHVAELHRALDVFAGPDRDPAVPAVIAGDINDLPGSPVWQALQARGTDAWAAANDSDGADRSGFTFSATNPRRRIDAVFADPAITVRSAAVLDTPDVAVASDHRPLLVELELP